jgi:hypothetical protein
LNDSILQNRESSLFETSVKKTDDELLMLAIKDAQFFQPAFNILTMRFKSEDETKFQAFLMGLNQPQMQMQNPPPASSNHHYSTKLSNSLELWASPQNILFASFLLSIVVNLCLSTAYLLSFIVSSMSSYEYKLSPSYNLNFIVIVSIFCVLCFIQFVLLVLNFLNCNKATSKRSKAASNQATTEFSGKVKCFLWFRV